ncbi:hypothetical protein F2P79_009105 [Pimephales promelas]|nr:hypothetical protein F2P79_009105 [Pimephales promelas]
MVHPAPISYLTFASLLATTEWQPIMGSILLPQSPRHSKREREKADERKNNTPTDKKRSKLQDKTGEESPEREQSSTEKDVANAKRECPKKT